MTYLKRNNLDGSNLTACFRSPDDDEDAQISERVRKQFAECGRVGNVKVTRIPSQRSSERNPFVQFHRLDDTYPGQTFPMRTLNRLGQQSFQDGQQVWFRDAPVVGQRGCDMSVFSSSNSLNCTNRSGPRIIDVQVHRNQSYQQLSSSGRGCCDHHRGVHRTFNVRNGIVAPPSSPSDARSDNGIPRTSTWTQLPPVSNSQTPSSFNTAPSGLSGPGSLEWDNYEPPVGVSFHRNTARNPQGITLNTLQYWV